MTLVNSNADDGRSRVRSSPAAGLFWFMFFSTAGLAVLAAAVLLPERAALHDLEARRRALAHQVRCQQRLAAYNDRLLYAMETDPVLRARLLIRHCNYRPTRHRTIQLDPASAEADVPARIMAEAASPPVPHEDALVAAGRHLSDSPTRAGMIVLSLLMVAAALLLFAPRGTASPRLTKQANP